MASESRLTRAERDMLADLRDRGFAVIVWAPDELGSAPPDRVKTRCIEQGWDTIDYLQGENQ